MTAALIFGLSLASTGGLGYVTPTVGGFARVEAPHVRALVEVDNSRKFWLSDGHSVRATVVLDGPLWRRIAPLVVAGGSRHSNALWSKGGAYAGAGARYRGVYGYTTMPDTSPNRTQRSVAGYETRRGRVWLNVEAVRLAFSAGRGWAVITRLGYTTTEAP